MSQFAERALLLVAATLVAGCSSPAPDSGIEGMVWVGPMCPVESDPPDPDCADRPYATWLLVTAPEGGDVLEAAASNDAGEFRVALEPGDYAIRSRATASGYPYCASEGTIVVVEHEWTMATIRCDTGIR